MAISKTDLTKEDLIQMNIDIIGNDVYHTSKKFGRKLLKPVLNTQYHPKGMIGSCSYYMIGWYHQDLNHKGRQYVFPYHRVLYAWYNGIAHKGLQILHIDGNSLNNNIENLKEDNVIANNRQRKGAKNQYWNRG